MKATVYVWPMHGGNVGHASLEVQGTYISFWPGDDIGKPQAKKGLKLKLSHASTSMQAVEADIAAEGGRRPLVFHIEPVDAQAILDYWRDIQSQPYQLRRLNCSSVVAECIYRGSKRKPSFTPSASDYSRWGKVFGYGIWTPLQVLRYAQELDSAEA